MISSYDNASPATVYYVYCLSFSSSSAEENERGLSWFILKTTTKYLLWFILKTTTKNLGLCLKQHPGKSNYCLCYKPPIYNKVYSIYILWYMLSIHPLPFFLQSDYLVCATNQLLPPLYSPSSNLPLAFFSIIKAKKGLKRAVLLDIYQI